MAQILETGEQDVMQVCRNGHLITDRLHSQPEGGRNRCERCGAETLSCCSTCGWELPGAVCIPGLAPVGGRQLPQYCADCGAAFPWATRRRPVHPDSVAKLDSLLRRLPMVIRQLRSRHGDRPPFRVEDGRDLEDLLRALLPLHFDDVRLHSRTPGYADRTCTDFLLAPEKIAVMAKYVEPKMTLGRLSEQIPEDAAYWAKQPNCRTLIAFIYDPESILRDARSFEAAWSTGEPGIEVRCVISAP